MKPLHFVGSSSADLKAFPDEVRSEAGFSIYLAQEGDRAINAVSLMGFGSSKVVEVVMDHDTNTYRAVYTVKFPEAVYVLHAFQKKAHRGRTTPKKEIVLVWHRLRQAEDHYRVNYQSGTRKERANDRGA